MNRLELRPKLAAHRADQLIVRPGMDFEPVETRCDLLDHVQLFEGILDPVLVTVLHLLEFLNDIIVAGLLGGGETLLEIRPRGLIGSWKTTTSPSALK